MFWVVLNLAMQVLAPVSVEADPLQEELLAGLLLVVGVEVSLGFEFLFSMSKRTLFIIEL